MSWLLFRRSTNQLLLFRSDPPSCIAPARQHETDDPFFERRFVGKWPAHNEAVGNGPWPRGYFKWIYPKRPEDTGPTCMNSRFGCQTRHTFDVPGRPGMQVHAGRWWVPPSKDPLRTSAAARLETAYRTANRPLPSSVPLREAKQWLSYEETEGCIRTTEEAMTRINRLHMEDGLKGIWVL